MRKYGVMIALLLCVFVPAAIPERALATSLAASETDRALPSGDFVFCPGQSFVEKRAGWKIARHPAGHPNFDTHWSGGQIRIDRSLNLNLKPNLFGKNRYLGSAIRREIPTGFGRYEAWLRPAKGEGLITGFFVYTGPTYGTRHNEIDFEFLGRDTTQAILSWWVDGHLRSRAIALGFDAAEAAHHYAFDWLPNGVRWYVDGRLIHTTGTDDVPQIAGYVFLNLWAASPALAEWAGVPKRDARARAVVQAVRFTPLNDIQLSLPLGLECRNYSRNRSD